MFKAIKALLEISDTVNPRTEATTTVTAAIKATLMEGEKDSYVSKRFSPGSSVCARFKAHQRLEDFKPVMKSPDADTLSLFKAGTAAHDMLQQEVLAKTGKLFGNWECASCGAEKTNTVLPKGACTGSRTRTDVLGSVTVQKCADVLQRASFNWKYVEGYMRTNPLNDPLYEIAGYRDGIWVEDGKWYILEIKSVDPLLFTGMSKVLHKPIPGAYVIKPAGDRLPLAAHVNQALVYSKMELDNAEAGTLPLDPRDFEGAIILYVNRNSFETKEYRVSYSDYPYTELLTVAKRAKDAVDAGDAFLAPARCTAKTNVLAERCPLRDKCFPPKPKKVKATKATKATKDE